MLGKQVKRSTQESPSQTEHLIPPPPPPPEDPRVPSITLLEGGALFVFCWGGETDRNKMAL